MNACVYTHTLMYAGMYSYIRPFTSCEAYASYVCIQAYKYVCIYACNVTHMEPCIVFTCIQTHTYAHTYPFIYMNLCKHTRAHTYSAEAGMCM